MKLSTKTRYGARAMLDLALHHGQEPVNIREVAERQQVSSKYLEQLMSALSGAGLVRSVRGPRGGYMLARPANEITLRQIFEALEGGDSFVDCTAHPEVCDMSDICATREVWAKLYNTCISVLESITLDDLMHRAREKQHSAADMYYI